MARCFEQKYPQALLERFNEVGDNARDALKTMTQHKMTMATKLFYKQLEALLIMVTQLSLLYTRGFV